MHACVRVMVPGRSRGLHICSCFGSSWVSSNQLLNNQGEIESDTVIVLRWLEIVSSTYMLMGSYNHSLSLDATIMVSQKLPNHR